MKRIGNLTPALLSDENILKAINSVNKTHRIGRHHKLNRTVLWVERTKPERMVELRDILSKPFVPSPTRVRTIIDKSSGKERLLHEPKLWPDQYVHHALVQILEPIIMRGMDYWNCGSIPKRGPKRGITAIQKWMRTDAKGTRYCAELDIRHFYQELKPTVVMQCMKRLIKDRHILRLIWAVIYDGVHIGSYCSQWFANAVLQPLDHMMREQLRLRRFIRYMDNYTIFASSKRKLHRAVQAIRKWLKQQGLELKGNWQVFPTASRMPDALGYRFSKEKTLPRKKPVVRFRRACRNAIARGKPTIGQARGILSRVGLLQCCNVRTMIRKETEQIPLSYLKKLVSCADRYWNRIQNGSKKNGPNAPPKQSDRISHLLFSS